MASDIEFDTLLANADPAATPRPAGLKAALDELVIDSEVAVGRRKRRRIRLTIAALSAAGLVGSAVGAQAGGLFRPQPSAGEWSKERAAVHVKIADPSLAPCQASYMVVPREQVTEYRSRAQWNQVWSAATRVLAGTDSSALQTPGIRERYRKSLSPKSVSQRTEADIWLGSIGAELMARVDAELKRKGLPLDMLLMSEAHDCDPDAF